ncbi:MAG: RNA polymerase sigma factor [Myxococcaceae bacterium]
MRAFREGDSTAFEALFARHSGPVHGFVAKLTGDQATAEDLTQVTFASILRSKDRFVDGMKFTPWLYAIATNAARGVHRQRKVRTRAADEQKAMSPQSVEPTDFDPGLQRALSEAIDQLPPAQREAVVLHKLQGLSFEEVAETLGVSPTAARIKAHRGYTKLRELLAHLKD